MFKRVISPLFCCVLLLSGCESNPQQPPMANKAIPVLAVKPNVRDVTTYLEAIGTLQSPQKMEIRPRVNGTLEKILVKEGQFVEEGAVLFEIEKEIYLARMNEAEASTRMGEADYEAVVRKLERYRSLADKDLISQNEWDELETQLEKAESTLKLNEARLKAAALDLKYCSITSPIMGRVDAIDLSPGALVSSSQATPLVVIESMDPLMAEFKISESEYASLNRDHIECEVCPICDQNKTCSGTITFLGNHFDPKTGLLLVKAKINNTDNALRPGQAMKVRIPLNTQIHALLIPQKAIRYNPQGAYLYVVNSENIVELRQVKLGKEEGMDQVILEGITENDPVITDGHLKIMPGAKVEVKS